jgi:hypothetical protein
MNAHFTGHSMHKRASRPWMRQGLASRRRHRRTMCSSGRHGGIINDAVDDHLANILIDGTGIRCQFRDHPGQLTIAWNVPVNT